MNNPYKYQEDKAFWRKSIANVHFADIENLWQPFTLSKRDKVATAGSCFAQHLGNNLAKRGANFIDLEPSPVVFETESEARRWGFGVFSCRYGNIYTTRQLLQLFEESFGHRQPMEIIWEKEGRFYDALRPGIDPVGQENKEDIVKLRKKHLSKVRAMFETLDLFVFTLGLTEGWENVLDGTMFPTAPGTIAGEYDAAKYRLHNLRYNEIKDDLDKFWTHLREVNPSARMLLTVSPVPLNATATEHHVLPATVYSKSVLRAVAGDMSEDNENVFYFPSYEIITAPQARGMFFNPDQRNVNGFGVDLVMKHFFSGALAEEFSENVKGQEKIDLICDEEKIDRGIV